MLYRDFQFVFVKVIKCFTLAIYFEGESLSIVQLILASYRFDRAGISFAIYIFIRIIPREIDCLIGRPQRYSLSLSTLVRIGIFRLWKVFCCEKLSHIFFLTLISLFFFFSRVVCLFLTLVLSLFLLRILSLILIRILPLILIIGFFFFCFLCAAYQWTCCSSTVPSIVCALKFYLHRTHICSILSGVSKLVLYLISY